MNAFGYFGHVIAECVVQLSLATLRDRVSSHPSITCGLVVVIRGCVFIVMGLRVFVSFCLLFPHDSHHSGSRAKSEGMKAGTRNRHPSISHASAALFQEQLRWCQCATLSLGIQVALGIRFPTPRGSPERCSDSVLAGFLL